MFKPLTSKLTGKFAAIAAVAVFSLTGCKQDGDTITINTPSTKQNAKVTYVIQVVDANNTSAGSAIAGATVRFFNGATQKFEDSRASDASGNIVLTNIQPGSFAGTVTATDFGSISFVADLSKAGTDTAYTATTRIRMFPQTASLTGKVFGNYLMTNTPANPTSASDVRQVELMLNYTIVQNGNMAYPMGSGPGRLVNVDLNPMSLQVTQEAGPTSAFLFDQAYSTESGMLQATLGMVPQRVTTTGTNPRDSTFTLASGNPRNNLRVNLYRNANGDNATNLGNLLAKPAVNP